MVGLVQAQEILQEIGDRCGEIRCLLELSRVRFQGSFFPEAVKFAKEVQRQKVNIVIVFTLFVYMLILKQMFTICLF
jgi:hypothetical protein